MGIQGLTTYIAQHSDVYFKNYSLHNTFLVIDGNAVASQLYNNDTKSNSCFGGDYDKYAYAVENFFDELIKCKVTPLIIIDGGSEDKKLSTIYKRTKDRIIAAHSVTPYKQLRTQIFPLLLKEVFKNTAEQKGIKCTQSLFEADDDIASVAKLLNCPVLSFDSDFYIFDVMYIPYNTLDRGIVKNPNCDGFVKHCKIYKIEYFLQRFPGMDKDTMPMAAVLLGNDYISRRNFINFFRTLKLSKQSKRLHNELQRRIEATFRWLQKQTLDSVIAKVLSKIDLDKREKILEVIEMIINGYRVSSAKMLIPLQFSDDYINLILRTLNEKPYKFQEDVRNLQVIEEPVDENESDLSCNEESNECDEEFDIVKPDNEKNLYKIAPLWFIKEFNAAHYPSYFIDMLTRQLYVCPVQIEDYSHPTCINISLKIIRIIFTLLNRGTSNVRTLEYVARGQMTSIVTLKLHCDDIFEKYPLLSQLREIPLSERKCILDSILGITDNFIEQFPVSWKLFIGTAKYWIDEAEPPFTTKCHLYAVLFNMLYHIIDKKIGYHRSQIFFERKYGKIINKLKCNKSNLQQLPIQNLSVLEALDLITENDCILALPFFLSNFVMTESLMKNSKKLYISTVHSFSLFQNCLRHIVHLNALLGYPYMNINIAEFFNGTLLYNLYNNFKSRSNIDNYISNILSYSPSLLQLFISMLTSVESTFVKAFQNVIVTAKRQRKKHKNKKCSYPLDEEESVEECDEYEEYEEHDNYVSYFHTSNRFHRLNRRE